MKAMKETAHATKQPLTIKTIKSTPHIQNKPVKNLKMYRRTINISITTNHQQIVQIKYS